MTTETTISLTDPAREIVQLCESLIGGTNEAGDQYLADRFGVVPYSSDFFRILTAIMVRFDQLEAIFYDLDLDTDIQGEMVNHLSQLKMAFTNYGLQNQWISAGATRFVAENIQPIKALSPTVRRVVSFRRLSDEDVADIATDATDLRTWLVEANLAERDFIRGMLIDGLDEFLFRLKYFNWVGSGYALDGLKQVIRAFLVLERGEISASNEPVAAATLQKLGAFLSGVWTKTQTARDSTETIDWALRMYVAYEAVSKGTPLITALIGKGATQ